MVLHIYDTLKKQKSCFKAREPDRVGLYVCGMTVYDYCHVGHARVLVVFDMITRYLRHCGYPVYYVRNITDIDDKILNRAKEKGEPWQDITAFYIRAMQEDAKKLGVLPADEEPCATAHIDQMQALIRTLFTRGFAYQGEKSGDVYFDVSRFPRYGRLAHKDIAGLQSGIRVPLHSDKRTPLDFVLWKRAKEGEPAWEADWGKGRPGWHIECSAMAMHYLGEHFDIHGGGVDLQFPHHQNEVAQSEGCSGGTHVNTWMHVGHVQVNQEKMSKSLGNFFTLRDVFKQFPPEVIRYFILASHYRSPVNYSQHNLSNAHAALVRFYTALDAAGIHEKLPPLTAGGQGELTEKAAEYYAAFTEKMDDDFNTPDAFAVLFDITRQIHRYLQSKEKEKAMELGRLLLHLGQILGLLQQAPRGFLRMPVGQVSGKPGGALSEQAIADYIAERDQARADKDWARSDVIRQQLREKGIVLEDGPSGTTWRREG